MTQIKDWALTVTGLKQKPVETDDAKNSVAEKNYSVAEIIKSPVQACFFAFGITTFLILIPFTVLTYRYVKENEANAPPDYEFP